MNRGMEFATEKMKKEEEKEKHRGSWWWPNVTPFVNGGSAKLVSSSLFFFLGTYAYCINYYMCKTHKIFWHSPESQELVRNHERTKTFLKRQPVPLFFEAITSAVSLGSFEILTKKATVANNGIPPSILQEVCCAALAGFIGAYPGAPLFLVENYILDNANPPKPKYLRYRNALEALYRFGAKQRVSEAWGYGVGHGKVAAAFYTGMLAPYNRSLDYFKDSCGFDDIPARLGAGAVSAFFASACSMPVSHVEATMRNMKPNADGKYPFTSALDCALKILKSRGFLALYKGFPSYVFWVFPHLMMTWEMFDVFQYFNKSQLE